MGGPECANWQDPDTVRRPEGEPTRDTYGIKTDIKRRTAGPGVGYKKDRPAQAAVRAVKKVVEHRRGLLQASGAVVGVGCTFVTGGLGAPACAGAAISIGSAGIAQSGADNLLGEERCPAQFVGDAVANVTGVVPLGRVLGSLGSGEQLVVKGLYTLTSSGMGAVSSETRDLTCG